MTSSFLLLLLLCAQLIWAEEKWVWSSKSKKDPKGPVTFEGSTTNTDNIIQTVDSIVIMGRSGRKVSGFDSLYEDPESLQALSSENETFARSAIAQRICSLKLTKCDEDTARHFNFGFGSGHHNQQGFIQSNAPVIVAQPVALRPVGPPVQAIPLTNVNHAQGINYNGGSRIQYGQTIHRPLNPSVFQGRPISGPIGPQRPFGLIQRPFGIPQPVAPAIRPIGSVSGDLYGNNRVQHVHQHVHYHNEEHLNGGHSNLIPIPIPKPIYEGPGGLIGEDYYRDQNQLNCDCVPLYQCDDEYTRRNFNQQHLAIDPRAPDLDIDIDDTNTTEVNTDKSNRKRRDVGTPNEDEGRSFSTIANAASKFLKVKFAYPEYPAESKLIGKNGLNFGLFYLKPSLAVKRDIHADGIPQSYIPEVNLQISPGDFLIQLYSRLTGQQNNAHVHNSNHPYPWDNNYDTDNSQGFLNPFNGLPYQGNRYYDNENYPVSSSYETYQNW